MSKPIPAKPVSFSGVQPSGIPSLGNILGAFKPFVAYQESHHAYFCIVDHHAITVRQNPAELRENTLAIAAWYIAAGLNPHQCTLFIQSHVTAHAELGWILNSFAQMGELERMTQYKDKSARNANNINAGLFTYPVLMAADILLYNTNEVPVGDDQTQHIELARDIATRFNNLYTPSAEKLLKGEVTAEHFIADKMFDNGPVFTIPKGIIPRAGARVKDLQEPTKKMSKSQPGPGTILMNETPAEAAKKIKRAQTDSLNNIHYDPVNQPGVANLLEILASISGRTPQLVAGEFKGQQYGALKNAVAEAVAFAMEPLQTRYAELMNDKAELQSILTRGADTARAVADVTLGKVMEQVGYIRR